MELKSEGRHAYAGELNKDDSLGSLQELDSGIDRLEETISLLERTLGPVINQYGLVEATRSDPESEPRSQLHARARRVHHISEALHALIQRIDL